MPLGGYLRLRGGEMQIGDRPWKPARFIQYGYTDARSVSTRPRPSAQISPLSALVILAG